MTLTMGKCKYTFLLPAYKASFFKEALNSIKAQSFTDYCVLVSDDCSPEELKPIFEEVCGNDDRFSYRRNEKNMGTDSLVAHWNLLVGMCETDYLVMASDDDIYDSCFLEQIDTLTNKYPDVELFRARAQIINEHGEVVRRDYPYLECANQLDFMIQYEQLCNVACVANYVYKTSTLQSIGGFFNYPLAWKSDTMTANFIAKNGACNTKDILFTFRVSGINISSVESRLVLQKKYVATKMKDDDMTKLIERLSSERLSTEDRNKLLLIQQKHKERTVSELAMFAVALPLKQFVEVLLHFNRKGYFGSKFEIVLLTKKWLYKKM